MKLDCIGSCQASSSGCLAFVFDSPNVVLRVTIAVNAAVYCFVFKSLIWLYLDATRH